MLWISSLTLTVYFPGMYTLIMRLTHALPELVWCLEGSEAEMQQGIGRFSALCTNFRLTINTKKTQVLHQPPSHHPYMEPSVTANGEVLNAVDKFTYLGSVLSRDVHVDNEVDAHIHSQS